MVEGNSAKAACSASDIYRNSEDREHMVDPRRGHNGVVYAQFMDDFWKGIDHKVASEAKPSTVGGALDLAQSAFLDAAKTNAKQLKEIGRSATLEFHEPNGDKVLDAKDLTKSPLSQNKTMQDALGDPKNFFALNVEFLDRRKDPTDLVTEQVIYGAQAGSLMIDPVDRLAPVGKATYGVPELYSVINDCKD